MGNFVCPEIKMLISACLPLDRFVFFPQTQHTRSVCTATLRGEPPVRGGGKSYIYITYYIYNIYIGFGGGGINYLSALDRWSMTIPAGLHWLSLGYAHLAMWLSQAYPEHSEVEGLPKARAAMLALVPLLCICLS